MQFQSQSRDRRERSPRRDASCDSDNDHSLVQNRGNQNQALRVLDTAAVISQLDLVVAPESAVAHLAGSMGCRVWVPLSTVGDWRWMLEREDSPWYPTMRLFRQTTPGDRDAVFERMAQAVSLVLP
jgi:hypothetical protein